jgi:hypothetical protein
MTTEKLLTELVNQKNAMTDRLKDKGISILENEKLNTLIPKISDIYQREGCAYGEQIPLFNSDSFTITNLRFKPTRIAISCDSVLTNSVDATNDYIYVALLNVDKLTDNETIYQLDNGVLYGGQGVNLVAEVTITEENGTYSVTVSFATLNEDSVIQYVFKGGELHQWVASSEDWIL